MILILPILILFTQIGFSWWLSVSTLSCFIYLRTVNVRNGFHQPSRIAYSALILIGVILGLLLNQQTTTHDALRVFREITIFGLIYFFANLRNPSLQLTQDKRILRISLIAVIALLSLTIIQFILLKTGTLLSIPRNYFSGRSAFSITSLDLRYSHIRPSGTFTEPSYLGLIFLSFFVIGIETISTFKFSKYVSSMSFVGIILSQSKSAIVFSMIIFTLSLRSKNPASNTNIIKRNKRVTSLIILAAIFMTATIVRSTLYSVIGSESLAIRVFNPARILLDFLISHPLGEPFYNRLSLIADTGTGITWTNISDNGFFNLFFSYGLIGILIILGIFSITKGNLKLKVFLLAAIVQNGSFLDIDKMALVFFTFTVCLNLNTIDFLSRNLTKNRQGLMAKYPIGTKFYGSTL